MVETFEVHPPALAASFGAFEQAEHSPELREQIARAASILLSYGTTRIFAVCDTERGRSRWPAAPKRGLEMRTTWTSESGRASGHANERMADLCVHGEGTDTRTESLASIRHRQ